MFLSNRVGSFSIVSRIPLPGFHLDFGSRSWRPLSALDGTFGWNKAGFRVQAQVLCTQGYTPFVTKVCSFLRLVTL